MGPARLLRVALDCPLAPEDALSLVRGEARPFALVGDWAGGGAIAGSEPVRIARPGEDPFALLADQPAVAARGGAEAAGAVGGGWFGWLGAGLARGLERISAPPPRPVALPASALAFYDHVLRADADGRWWFEALWTRERDARLAARRSQLEARAAAGGTPPRSFATVPWRSVPGPAGHAAAVRACRERIHAGDLFQANVCLRLESELLDGEAADLFAAGVRTLCPARAAYVGTPDGDVASLSPELFLSRRGRIVRSDPIKGTRPRPADPAAAERERAALAASEKDRAENVMIVDLVRNDLGRVCVPGSVRVANPGEVRAHTGVWHLVSEVEGRLADGLGDAELLRATFPPGSVTGAPKVAALDVIAELESTGREVYTGAIGFASPIAGLELSVAIRTVEHAAGRLWLGVGGGIVADSDPAAEAAETATKAAPVLRALGGALADAAPGRAAPPPPRLGPRPLPRPDPAHGVFATILARGGVAVAGARHLLRLQGSVRALYGLALPAGASARLHAAAAAAPDPGRLRVTARPGAEGLDVHFETGPHPVLDPGSAPAARLRSFTVPGGLGPHKWSDRRLLDALAAAAGHGEVVLLCDLDGLVLEAARANVAIAEGGELLTPPADGRIWAGTTRERLLAAGALREAPIALDRLLAADAVVLTGALRGAEPVAACDGAPLPDATPAAVRLGSLLHR